MDIIFKNASNADVDKLFELNKKLIGEYETNLNLDFEKVYAWVKEKIENNIESYQCIYFRGTKAGYFYLHRDGEKLELDDLFVFDEFQGRGIGTKVLKYVSSLAKETGKAVFLYVFVKNRRAVDLYLKNGYRITETVGGSRYIMLMENGGILNEKL
jgi:GNAT superfamily N-acetyltransferase